MRTFDPSPIHLAAIALFIFFIVWYWRSAKRSNRKISGVLWGNLLAFVYWAPVFIGHRFVWESIKAGRASYPEWVYLLLEYSIGIAAAVGLRFLLFGKRKE